jgi:hypothetical protein
MISIIHYISACRRLKESEKTVMMLGGERECQEMILAQRDMIKLEKEYYHDEVMKLVGLFLIFAPISIIGLVTYFRIYN